jgi:tetratricopeptide (TPR) repeat protein
MKRIEKTVFISYRRTNGPWALAIYQNLKHEGYDVFFDYTSIPSGDFATLIEENIKSRAHFLVLLTPSALERCAEPGDWLRREIEIALDTRRNIIPLQLESFDFGSPVIASQLTGKLAALRSYNGLRLSVEYFQAAMDKLREQFLNIALDAVLHPVSKVAQQAVQQQQLAAAAAPPVLEVELTAQDWFEKGFSATDNDEKLRCYSEAIRLKPDYAGAYINRGNLRQANGDLEGALRDYDEAIQLEPDHSAAYYNRGIARKAKGDLEGALRDHDEAIQLGLGHAGVYGNRGNVRGAKGDLDGALKDYEEVIRLRPYDDRAYFNRGIARKAKGDLDGALKDYDTAIRLEPNNADAYYNRGNARKAKGDLDGALKDYDTAIRLDPSNADAYYNRGHARTAKGDLQGAWQDFSEDARLKEGDGLDKG